LVYRFRRGGASRGSLVVCGVGGGYYLAGVIIIFYAPSAPITCFVLSNPSGKNEKHMKRIPSREKFFRHCHGPIYACQLHRHPHSASVPHHRPRHSPPRDDRSRGRWPARCLRAYSMASANHAGKSWNSNQPKVADGPLTSRLQKIKEGDHILVGRKATRHPDHRN